jgi:putative cell wall-binding protein
MTTSSAPRRALTSAALLATSVAAALSGAAGSAQAAAAGDAASPLTLSFGTSTLQVGSHDLTLSTTVTDAAWSPDGGRVAFVNGDGNIATANADGGDVLVLTTTNASVTRSHPAWEDGGAEIVFAEKAAGGLSKLMSVDANGLLMGKAAVAEAVVETSQDTTDDSNPDTFFSGFASTLVYEHTGTAGPEVWILDRNTRGPQGAKLTDGAQPTISPDGTKVAFVDAAGQIETIGIPVPVVNNAPAPVLTKVTNVAAKHFDRPAWSPDGKTLAFEGLTPGATPTTWVGFDTETAPAAGGTAPTQVAQRGPNVPAYQPLNKHVVHRVAGSDRILTATSASQSTWATQSAGQPGRFANAVVLSRSDQFADALGGSALARWVNGPLLLTPTAQLRSEVQDEIQRVLGPVNVQYPQTVFLLGGEKALAPSVAATVQALGYRVQRLGGMDRYSTSAAIADHMTTNGDGSGSIPNRIMVATGVNYADALSAGAAAAGGVVVLTADTVMPPATANFLNKYRYDGAAGSVPVYAIGGQANSALQSVGFGTSVRQYTDVHGDNRYATSLMVAKTFFDAPAKIGFATGLNWADALSGGAMMGTLNGPLLLTDPNTGPYLDTLTWLRHTGPQVRTALVFGGQAVLSDGVNAAIGQAISGPAGFDLTDQPTLIP